MASTQQLIGELDQKRMRLEEELREVEKQARTLIVYNLETSYLNDSTTHGNVLKGFEGALGQHKPSSLKRARNFKTEERLFSLSSISSPAQEELQNERLEERGMGRTHKSMNRFG